MMPGAVLLSAAWNDLRGDSPWPRRHAQVPHRGQDRAVSQGQDSKAILAHPIDEEARIVSLLSLQRSPG